MKPVELKIKSKSLQAEAQFIRKEEAKSKKAYRYHRDKQQAREARAANFRTQMLANHRRVGVRNAAHETFLARAFLSGKPYSVHGRKYGRGPLDFSNVINMIVKYGDNKDRAEVARKVQTWWILT